MGELSITHWLQRVGMLHQVLIWTISDQWLITHFSIFFATALFSIKSIEENNHVVDTAPPCLGKILIMKDAEEPGHDQHPKGGYTKGMFSGVHTPDDFADTIGVPRKAIRLVRPQNDRCKSRGCLFNAISNNGGRCPAHQRSWYPLSNGRGGNLHGPDFLRPQTNGHRACDCDQKACFSAGYLISEMVLNERWDLKMRKELYQTIHGRQYDGGDL
jgi:hypothetical protein